MEGWCAMSKPTSELRQKYINELTLRGCSVRTIEAYVSWVYDLARYHHLSPDKLSDDQIKAYMLHLKTERDLCGVTIRQAVYSLRGFYTMVIGRPVEELRTFLIPPRIEVHRPEVYSIPEVDRLLIEGTRELRERAFLATVYSAGLRLNEACHLRVKDLIGERHQIRVVQGKGNKDRYTILSDRLLELLRDYWKAYQPGEWLFPTRGDLTKPMSDCTGQRIYNRAVERSGIQRRGGIHTLRHTFATHLLEAGVNLPTLQRLLGHGNLGTTAGYLHIKMDPSVQQKSPLNLIDINRLRES